MRGVTSIPGIYFLGLPLLYMWLGPVFRRGAGRRVHREHIEARAGLVLAARQASVNEAAIGS
jgi:hypothetical protein